VRGIVISMIRRYIALLEEGEIFTTRDVLQFGMRAAVDRALSRLVCAERIRRLARGVFVKVSTFKREYSDLEIATAKAQAFGRKIIKAPLAVINPVCPGFARPACDKTFYIDGHSSKFKIGDTTITFRHSAPRKRQLSKTKAGETARALWYLGPKLADSYALQNATLWFQLSGDDRIVFRKNIRWMPAWLSDLVKYRPWDRSYDKRAVPTEQDIAVAS
jgi:Family of unknown function (DUF6088)